MAQHTVANTGWDLKPPQVDTSRPKKRVDNRLGNVSATIRFLQMSNNQLKSLPQETLRRWLVTFKTELLKLQSSADKGQRSEAAFMKELREKAMVKLLSGIGHTATPGLGRPCLVPREAVVAISEFVLDLADKGTPNLSTTTLRPPIVDMLKVC